MEALASGKVGKRKGFYVILTRLNPGKKLFLHSGVTFSPVNRHSIMSIEPFHEIILPMKDRLFRLAYGIVRDRAEAEDILQDLLLKLWSRKEEWSDIENLEAYCFRAIKNMALDRLASMAVRKTGTIEREQEDLYFVDSHSPHRELVRKEQRLLIEQCMEELPENQQLTFRLREVEGMSYREIAHALAISEDLVKISLFRARKKMKELLAGYDS
jgi:RNA polymerase sigma-70 factor (ECF subfamily)